MPNPQERHQLAEERRNHTRVIERLRSEYAPSRVIDQEYQQHMDRIAKILGDDGDRIVDGVRTV